MTILTRIKFFTTGGSPKYPLPNPFIIIFFSICLSDSIEGVKL
jgi:hypothetical protein